jgi:hypothetical protein
MSTIIKPIEDRELAHIVKTNTGNYYYVDSADTFDQGFETMAFEYDIESDEVTSWVEVYVERYDSEEEMETRHKEICLNLEEGIKANE